MRSQSCILFFLCFLPSICLVNGVNLTRLSEQEWEEFSCNRAKIGRSAEIETSIQDWLRDCNKTTPDEFAIALQSPQVELALAQLELISKCKSSLAKISADKNNHAFMQHMLSDVHFLNQILLSGPMPGDYSLGLQILCKFWNEYPETRDGLWRKVAVAISLEFSESPPKLMHAFQGEKNSIDPFTRYTFYKNSFDKNILFSSFNDITTWEMRQVVSSPHRESDLEWAQQQVGKIKNFNRINSGTISGAFGMVPYRMKNSQGVSIHSGAKFYDDKKITLQLLTEYGGVCGAVSKFGSAMCQAYGIPSIVMGQPGHCAFAWKNNDRWIIGNDIYGWGASNINNSKRFPFGGVGAQIPLMADLYKDESGFRQSHRLLQVSQLVKRGDLSLKMAELALDKCPINVDAWNVISELFKEKSKSDLTGDRSALSFLERASKSFKDNPSLAVHWTRNCGPQFRKKCDKELDGKFDYYLSSLISENANKNNKTSVLSALQIHIKSIIDEEQLSGKWDAFTKCEARNFFDGMPSRKERYIRKIIKDVYDGCESDARARAFFKVFAESKN